MRRAAALGPAAALGAGAAWALPALAPVLPPVAAALRVGRDRPGAAGIALTFDDGPHPQGTPAVLDALAREGVCATFFLVGEQVAARPALAAEIAAAGHAIAVHGHRHRVLLRVPPRAVAEDLDRAASVIAEATGCTPRLHRPPLGIYSYPALAQVRRRGWRPLLWSRWGRDWAGWATPRTITWLVTRDLQAGDVLLLHDSDAYSAAGSWKATAAAVPRIVDVARRRGLAIAPVER